MSKSRLRLLPSFMLVLACSSCVPAGPRRPAPAAVVGDISDATTREPIVGADVALVPAEGVDVRGYSTRASGRFEFRSLRPGQYGLEVAAPGYVTRSWPNLMVESGQTLPLDLRLSPGDPASGKPLEVNGWSRPVLLSGPEIEYTGKALGSNVTGKLIVTCLITEEGQVTDCRVLQSVPFMDEAVVSGLQKRRYRPSMLRGVARAMTVTFRINLVLGD